MEIIIEIWEWVESLKWWSVLGIMWVLSMGLVTYAMVTSDKDPNEK